MASLKFNNQKDVFVLIEYSENSSVEDLEAIAKILEVQARAVRRQIERQLESQQQGADK